MPPRISSQFSCKNVLQHGSIYDSMICDELETAQESTCLVDRVSAGGRCKAAVTARTRGG